MITEKYQMETELVASDDLQHTYEIKRKWNDSGSKLLIIELYPTISADRIDTWDVSTVHLMNHVSELGTYGEVKIVNLFSQVFRDGKPSAGQLKPDIENLAYIEELLEEAPKQQMDIAVAWGSTLSQHQVAKDAKRDILSMIKRNGLADRTKHIITETLDTEKQIGTHPLYLGLRFSKEKWSLSAYPLEEMLKGLDAVEEKPDSGTEKKKTRKGRKKNVSEDNGQA
jgi:hypothetical protein